MVPISADTRCYTRLEPRLRDSVFCGAGYSCVKITQVSSDWPTAGHVTTLRASDWLTSDHAARSDVRPVRLLRGAGAEGAPGHPLQGMLRPRPSIRKYNHNFIIFVCGYKQNRDLPIVLHISPQTFQQRSFAHFLLFSFGIPPKILLAYPFGKNYQNQIYSNKAAICPCCKCLFKKHFVSGLLLHLPVWAGVLLVLLQRSLQHFPSQWPRTLSDHRHGDAVK